MGGTVSVHNGPVAGDRRHRIRPTLSDGDLLWRALAALEDVHRTTVASVGGPVPLREETREAVRSVLCEAKRAYPYKGKPRVAATKRVND